MTISPAETGRLLGNFAHDMRTPLATIFGFAKTIERRAPLDETQARYLDMISAAALDLERIISMLSLTSRVLRGTLEPRPTGVSTRTLAAAVIARLREDRGEQRIRSEAGVDGVVNTDHDLAVEALGLLVTLPLRLEPSLGEAVLEPLTDGVRIGPVRPELASQLGEPSTDVALETARLVLAVVAGRMQPEPAALTVRFAT